MPVNEEAFNRFCAEVDTVKCSLNRGTLLFENSRRQEFPLPEDKVVPVLERLLSENAAIRRTIQQTARVGPDRVWQYNEGAYRAVARSFFDVPETRTFYNSVRSQTRAVLVAINKYIGFLLNRRDCGWNDSFLFEPDQLEAAITAVHTTLSQDILPTSVGTSGARAEVVATLRRICDFCQWDDQFAGGERQRILLRDPEGIRRSRALRADLGIVAGWLREHFSQYQGVSFAIAESAGQGRTAHVPWVCILPPDQNVSNGVYVALCFGRHGEGLVVGCAQSASAQRPDFPAVNRTEAGFAIDVNGDGPGTQYNDVFANPLEILATTLDEQRLLQHLRESLELAVAILGLDSNVVTPEEELNLAERALLPRFEEFLAHSGLRYSSSIARRFLLSLLAKPFVILTGNSGSGKTRIAIGRYR